MGATNSGDRRVSQSESALESALVGAGHPVSVTVHVGSSFQHYSSGVFSDPQCQYGQLNHAILAVGYEKSGSSYWMVKNSWGSSWGSQGYINMKIGENSWHRQRRHVPHPITSCLQHQNIFVLD